MKVNGFQNYCKTETCEKCLAFLVSCKRGGDTLICRLMNEQIQLMNLQLMNEQIH